MNYTVIITSIFILIYLLQCIGLAFLLKKAHIQWWLAFVPFGNYIIIGKVIKDMKISIMCAVFYILEIVVYLTVIPYLNQLIIPEPTDFVIYGFCWVTTIGLAYSYCRLMIKLCKVFKSDKKIMVTSIFAPVVAICLFGMSNKYQLAKE